MRQRTQSPAEDRIATSDCPYEEPMNWQTVSNILPLHTFNIHKLINGRDLDKEYFLAKENGYVTCPVF